MRGSKTSVQQKKAFLDQYDKFDSRFNVQWDTSYKNLVNFGRDLDEPISRWFYYQEGYSPQLVKKILNDLGPLKTESVIIDPFAGSGTTLLVAKQLGINSIGFEINPFSAFMIRVKTRNYTKKEIRAIKNFRLPKYRSIKRVFDKYELSIIHKMFSRNRLVKIELLKEKISRVRNEAVRDALFAALLSIIEDTANYRKGGNGLKKKSSPPNRDPFEGFHTKRLEIYEDLMKFPLGPEPVLYNDSCLKMQEHLSANCADLAIFSPPYANCFDPFEVYKMELWIGEFVKSYDELREWRKRAITSNLNANVKKSISKTYHTDLIKGILKYLEEQHLWDNRLPKMLDTYFFDMYNTLATLHAVIKPNGYCIIVVGNSAYGNLAVPTDLLLAQLGEKVGFKVEKIVVARKNETSSQQYKRIGNHIDYIRESLIILKNGR